MSQIQATTRKDKKAKRDQERQRLKSSRKSPQDDAAATQRDEADHKSEPYVPVATKTQLHSSLRKRKREHTVSGNVQEEQEGSEKNTKKHRRAHKAESNADTITSQEAAAQDYKGSKSRFIVFVGNLPYSTTDESLQTYFKKLAPFTLRHRTDPKSKKSKGFAFLEFENYDRMKTCLKLYHHSMFNSQKTDNHEEVATGSINKDKFARRINVELTAGGGGKGEARTEKLKAKNTRLDEQRKRRAELERKEAAKKAKAGKPNGARAPGLDDISSVSATAAGDASRIHPSRLARMHA